MFKHYFVAHCTIQLLVISPYNKKGFDLVICPDCISVVVAITVYF